MKLEEGQKYRLRLVPANCQREEVIFEVISALDHLSDITDEIFGKLQERLKGQRAQVDSLRARLQTTANKVSSLKNSPKLIHILSPAKFPEPEGVERPEFFETIRLRPLGPGRSLTDTPDFLSSLRGRRVPYNSPGTHVDDLLQYYRVRDLNYTNASNLSQLGAKYELGLGNPPPDVEYVDSFFLFNTNVNPYEYYVISDGAAGGGTVKDSRKAVSSTAVDMVGQSKLSEKVDEKVQDKEELDDFYYFPSAVQIPQIDLPEHLPSLPGLQGLGLAETLSYDPDPVPDHVIPVTLSRQADTHLPRDVESRPVPPRSVSESTQKPPFKPPPAPPLPPPFPTTVAPAVPAPPNSPFSPPPPPPPPPVVEPAARAKPNTSVKPEPPTGSSDMRSSLMAAIRDAGGKGRLKSTKEEATRPEPKAKGGQSGGGDLLEDLKHSLAMRRRGISGLNEAGKGTGMGEIMRKMASSMPPPLDDDSFDSQHNLSEEDDWD